jgi:DNA (cytosine-5)-methyltransferase 1
LVKSNSYSALEICAGGGGQALGLDMAGFSAAGALEIDRDACETLRLNRPSWKVIEADLKEFDATAYKGIDLFAGGVPCPPFSIAGKQLGADDDRDLFPSALRLIDECKPTAVLLENVRGLASARFEGYRTNILRSLYKMGFEASWKVLKSCDYGVPQLRPRFVLVAIKSKYANSFMFPAPLSVQKTVSGSIYDLIAADGWSGADAWKEKANEIAPTIVGGSKKHGGADLGPTRAKSQWALLGVDGKGIANSPPSDAMPADFLPRLTLRMAARIQGFPDDWEFCGGKTSQYRQIGNAFPPPVASAVATAIRDALDGKVRDFEIGEQIPMGSAAA